MTGLTAGARTRVGVVSRVAAGRPLPAWYSLLLGGVLVLAAGFGLLAGDAYRMPDDLAAQARGQDMLTLLTVPVLVWAAARAGAGSLRAHLLWLGLLVFYVYSYLAYAFTVPHTDAFLPYVAVVGLSGYGLLDGLLRVDVAAVAPAFDRTPWRFTAVLLLASGTAFAVLWLADIVAAFPGGVPDNSFPHDLPNPVYVLDLGLLIPAVLAAGVLLRRRHPAGPVLGAVLLCKILTLSLSILAMTGFMLAGGHAVDAVLVAMFTALTVLTSGLLAVGARRVGPIPSVWLHRGVWGQRP